MASEGIFPPAVNPLTLPPRLLFRALDDLHAIAEAARRLPDIEATLIDRFERLEQRADAMEDQLQRALELGERINDRGAGILETGERLLEQGAALHERGGVILEQGVVLERRAAEVAESGRELAATFPTLERAAEIGETLAQAVEPLLGAADRLGRMADRLPGGQRAAGSR